MDLKKNYEELYGSIPTEEQARLDYLIQTINTKRGLRFDFMKEINRINGIKWNHLEFIIYLVPKGTPRPRSGKGNHFYVKGASDNKKFFKEFYKTWSTHPKIVTPCKMTCTSYLPITKNMKKYEMILAELGLIRPIIKPDFDNLIKTYADMIQGTLLADDCLIIEGSSRKYYSVKPRVEISIDYMEEFDSVFNKNKMKGKEIS